MEINALVAAAALAAEPAWSWERTIRPGRPEPLAFGPAIAAAPGGTLWIGPARDLDVGDGPTAATGLEINPGPGFPVRDSWHVAHPGGDRGAGFALAVAAAPGLFLAGSPHAGCDGTGCDTGQAHLAVRGHDGAWTVAEVACPAPRERAGFGGAVATDGRTVVIASPRDGTDAWDAGAVDVYELDPAAPGAPPRHVARLRSPAPQPSARFGAAVAVDGDWLAVGEPGAHGPAGIPPLAAGAVHLARRDGAGRWTIAGSLRASAGDGGWLGAGLALAGDHLVAGAPIARDPATAAAAGAALHFTLRDGAWTLRRVLRAAALPAGAGFGMSVAIADGTLAIGAPGDDAGGEDAGAAFVTDLRGAVLERLAPPSPASGAGFGAGLAFGSTVGWQPDGPRRFLAVSGRADPEVAPTPGAVELFAFRGPQPVLLARAAPAQPQESADGPQSRSASAIAIAAEASVTSAGRQPAAAARACASSP